MGKQQERHEDEMAAFLEAMQRGEIPQPPSGEALWMHFASILAEPLPMTACIGLAEMLRDAPGDLYLSDGVSRHEVAVVGSPPDKGDLPLVVDNRCCAAHPCLRARIRRWMRTEDYRRLSCVGVIVAAYNGYTSLTENAHER